MWHRLLPKYLVTAIALSVAIVGIVAAVLTVNYNHLAQELSEAGLAQKEELLSRQFEARVLDAVASLEREVDAALAAGDLEAVRESLKETLADLDMLRGLTVIDADERRLLVSGKPVDPEEAVLALGAPYWGDSSVVAVQPIRYAGETVGELQAEFSQDEVVEGIAAFRDRLQMVNAEHRRRTAIGLGLFTTLIVLVCIALAWATARRLVTPIRELIHQARNVSAGHYGEQMTVDRMDELGELATAFNDMRGALRDTTISRDYLDRILNSMNDGVIVCTNDGRISRVNTAISRMLGYRAEELVGLQITDLVASEYRRKFRSEPEGGAPSESVLITRGGQSIPVSWTGSTLHSDDGNVDGRIFALQNIAERKRAEQRIRYLARIDALTKVPNRMQFQHLLQRAIARARRERRCLGLLYIDADHFKDINDTFGHLAGDTALETMTERLIRELPENTVIGRLAGDEFAVVVEPASEDGTPEDQISEVAGRLLATLAQPFQVQSNEVFMTASIGIAFYPEDAGNVIDLIRNADAALYHAKKAGGNTHRFYSPEMNEAAVERMMLKSRLRRAYERDELLLHYQPKYNLHDGTVVGAEALVRWELPDRGLILPSEFIPLAEETNLIVEIGEWVLERVCADYREWQQRIPLPGRVAVNLSLKQLRQRNFPQRVDEIVRRPGVSPTFLELEITETTLMEDPQRTIRILDELYAMGLHLAIDDFGTGYSSLSALQQFPISTLKIDKSFVRDVAVDPDDATIVATIIEMGRSLKMDVVAEGVETEEQLAFLQTLDCTYVQGLLFGDPMTADDYLELLIAQEEGTDTHRALFA
ncbi:MAG: EAL domain-containing protein [Gammaproteobacteria bacterium]